MINIAINGFGRIGKNFLRILVSDLEARTNIFVKAINIGLSDPEAIAHSFKYDSILKTYNGSVEYKNNMLIIDNYPPITILSFVNPEDCRWGDLNIDWVIESSGKFTEKKLAIKHINSGAKKVLITAPATNEDITIIPGVNNNLFDSQKHIIVSLGSCTTNALAPLLDVMNKKFEIEHAAVTTVHAYTNAQALLDVDIKSSDMRRGRAAALNIVPTSTGATSLIDKIFPDLSGKISGCSIRVPVPAVSLIDLACWTKKEVDPKLINQAFIDAKSGYLKNILDITDTPLVSSDYEKNSNSVTVDSLMTTTTGKLSKIFGWYDNEWAYSCRLKDFLLSCCK